MRDVAVVFFFCLGLFAIAHAELLTGPPQSPYAAKQLINATSSLSGDVTMNNTSNYFDGPSTNCGSACTLGTWFASGNVVVYDTAGLSNISCKLWDGTTVIDSAIATSPAASYRAEISLSGVISSAAGNLKISCKDATATTGLILFNSSGNSKDSTITAIRIW
jgi:hypothetical protein